MLIAISGKLRYMGSNRAGTDRIIVDLPDDLEYFNGYIKVIARNNCGDGVVPEGCLYDSLLQMPVRINGIMQDT